MKPFGEFAAERFVLARPVLQGQRSLIEEAAWVYLYRFDRHLTNEFVHETFASLASRVADAVGWSVAESRRISLRSFHDSSRKYFSVHWDKLQDFVDANSFALWRVRRRLAQRFNLAQSVLGPDDNAVQEVNGVAVDVLQAEATRSRPVLVKVFADYCTQCAALAPEFEAAARTLFPKVKFVSLNGPENISTVRRLGVLSYPTILRMEGPRGTDAAFSPRGPVVADDIVAFAGSDDIRAINGGAIPESMRLEMQQSSEIESNERRSDAQLSLRAASISAEHDPDPAGAMLGQWAGMLRRQGIDELEALVRDRDVALHLKIDSALRCNDAGCRLPPELGSPADNRGAPIAILLGGGMGSGKTSVVDVISRTEFWRSRGSSVVVVEADAFKQTDPVYTALTSIGVTKAAGIVHRKSLEGAEELLLLATQQRRDVVFDGTMAWKPFVDQTIAMLRDPEYWYTRGPGYSNGDNKSELYWVRSERREIAVQPYQIEVVGVSADASVAVERAIVRSIVTGRSVPVREQLESHRRFSSYFELYAGQVDAAYLFDMSASDDVACAADNGTPLRGLIASKPGVLFPDIRAKQTFGCLAIENIEAFSRFLQKKDINVNACSADELFASETSSLSSG
jgi:thiol-disulfide isomerase/thioredoxin